MKPRLFTIGHSTHALEKFLKLLRQHRIEAIADVRSNPYSRWSPHFNRERLEKTLRESGICYVFLGVELGARRDERECYVDGVARYERIARTAAFQSGLQRIQKGAGEFRLAMMCAEKDPLTCHRTILVCRLLREQFDIQHILADGSLESQDDAETRLMKEEKVATTDLFRPAADLLVSAYDQRAEKIAYREKAK